MGRLGSFKFSLYDGYTQVIIVSFIAFCCPGLFNALSGVGGGGSSDPSVNSFVNFCLYATFAVFGYTGGMFYNLMGPKLLFILGASTYSVYSLCAYLANEDSSPSTASWGGDAWIASGALLGVGAGLFWTAQGALMMAYAPEHKKGKYISIFWIIFNLGGVMGGFIMFAVNYSNAVSAANPASYFVFVGLMVAGVLLGVFIVNPSLVTKEDGSKVKIAKQRSVGEELKAVLSVITDYNMIRLFPIFFSSNFFYTYVFNAFNGALFTVRTRGFNSAFFWMAQMFGSVMFAKVVDVPKDITRSIYNRAWRGYALVFVIVTISWAIGLYLQLGFRGGYVNVTDLADEAIIDFQDKDWVFPFFVMIGYGLADSIIQTFSYWIMSVIAGNDSVLAARYAGYYKGVQSLGAAVAWLLDSNYIMTPARTQLYICVVLFYVSMVPVIPVIIKLKGVVFNDGENDEDLSSSTNEQSLTIKGNPVVIPEQV